MIDNPFNLYSQRLDFKDQDWQEKGCAIASLLMIMDRLKPVGKKLPNLNKLYQVGLNRRAYIAGVGWRHSGLGMLSLEVLGSSSVCCFLGED